MSARSWLPIFAVSLVAVLSSGCVGGRTLATPHPPDTGGSASAGKQLIAERGCGKCHTIPGISNAKGVVGPPLNAMGRRSYIAGIFPNTPQNMIQWVMSPKSMKPKTAMPSMGLSEQQAKDVAAYLYTLR